MLLVGSEIAGSDGSIPRSRGHVGSICFVPLTVTNSEELSPSSVQAVMLAFDQCDLNIDFRDRGSKIIQTRTLWFFAIECKLTN